MVLLVHRWLPNERLEFSIAKAFSLLNWRNFSTIRLRLRLKMFQDFHIGNGACRFKRVNSSALSGAGHKNSIKSAYPHVSSSRSLAG